MATRQELLNSIASTVADYRVGAVQPMDAAHVDRWVCQFDAAVQLPILTELEAVLKRTYFSRSTVELFLKSLVKSPELAGADPCAFWRGANFLAIQTAGHSQRDMLAMFDAALSAECGFTTAQCGSTDGVYVYLDDGIFSGSRMVSDLSGWVAGAAPATTTVHVIVIAMYLGGYWRAKNTVEAACQAAKKQIDICWWRGVPLENRRAYINNADVLAPTAIPNDAQTQAYVATLNYPPVLRTGTGLGSQNTFSTLAGREILEQEFLKKGVDIRRHCPLLNQYQRPLGNTVLQTVGFGSLVATFRNCPNNAPLVFWAGDPWYPLFPRKTN